MPETVPKTVRARAGEYLRRIGTSVGEAETARAFQPPPKLYRISEIAQHLGLTRQTIHNYATIGLITEEARTPGGQRLFDESVFARLMLIHRMKRAYRLQEIRRVLEGQAGPSEAPAAEPPDSRRPEAGPDVLGTDPASHGTAEHEAGPWLPLPGEPGPGGPQP